MSRQNLEDGLVKQGLPAVDAARIASGMEFYFGPSAPRFLVAPYTTKKNGNVLTVTNANDDGVVVVDTDARRFRAPVNPDFSY